MLSYFFVLPCPICMTPVYFAGHFIFLSRPNYMLYKTVLPVRKKAFGALNNKKTNCSRVYFMITNYPLNDPLNLLETVNIAIVFRDREIKLYRHFFTANETGQQPR